MCTILYLYARPRSAKVTLDGSSLLQLQDSPKWQPNTYAFCPEFLLAKPPQKYATITTQPPFTASSINTHHLEMMDAIIGNHNENLPRKTEDESL